MTHTRTRPLPIPSDASLAPPPNCNVGIWIDTQKASLIRFTGKAPQVRTVTMDMERHKHILKARNHGARGGGPLTSSEKHEQSGLDEEMRRYLAEVMDAIGLAEHIVVFGPAQVKNELGKALREDARWRNVQLDLITADSMTPNQKVAWVKRYFNR
ncbi:MAG: hypothetical protein ABI432_08525 [Flavobacteriales bacterium]